MNLRKKHGLIFILFVCGVVVIGGYALNGQERIKKLPLSRGLAAPVQISPANGTEFHNYPRIFTMKWQAIEGATYEIEIDCNGCSSWGKWDSETGLSLKKSGLLAASFTFDFYGDNQGRWRVRAAKGQLVSPWSPWWYFSFKTSATPAEKPNVCIDGLLKIGNKTTPWGQNYTITLTPQDAISVSAGKAAFNIHYGIKNCKGVATGKFMNQVLFNDQVVSQQTNLQLGAAGSTLPIHTQAYLPIQDGILKIKLDAANNVIEDWENDNEVWVNVKFRGF